MPIPVHDDRILQYIYPLYNVPCPGPCKSPKQMNVRGNEMSDTYWCPYCYVDFKHFILVDVSRFPPQKLSHIKAVVKKFLQERRGYFVNIRY
jgi:hypothetical protein